MLYGLAFVGLSLGLSSFYGRLEIAYLAVVVVAAWHYTVQYLDKQRLVLFDRPVGMEGVKRDEHDKRRFQTYSGHHFVPNTWYHLCDSDELKSDGKVMEIRALGQVLALWRTSDGQPVCHDAFCLHQGANLAVGGKVEDDCIECPFHQWKFDKSGCIKEIPYIKNPTHCPTQQKLKHYKCIDYCGLVCIYFHADNGIDVEPEFELPEWLPKQIESENYVPHQKWNVGFYSVTVTDWVDQAGDHAHFHTLHSHFFIPYTLIPIPKWLTNIFPIGICHNLITYRGDDSEWEEKMKTMPKNMGCKDKHLLYFSDTAGLTWDRKAMPTTMSETLEMYMGPAIVAFHVPFTIGTFKLLFSVLPVEGGSILRVRTLIDQRTSQSYIKRMIAYLLTGISASQLAVDIDILTNKIRMKKPILQPFDGPYNRVNSWLKTFYSKSSDLVGKSGYVNDW